MKKKFLCFLLAFLLALPCLYHPIQANAIAPVPPVPFIFGTAWVSTVTAYGALKGLQFGQNSSNPEIVGDYTKPYQYQPESITPLKPSWDSFKTNWIADNFAGIYPALSEEDAKSALDKQWEDFDNVLGVQGLVDMTSPVFNAFNEWISSLVGTDYIKATPETANPVLGASSFTVACQFPDKIENGMFRHYHPNIVTQSVSLPSGVNASDVTGVIIRNIYYPINLNSVVGYINTKDYSYRIYGSCSLKETWVRDEHNNLIGFDYTDISPNFTVQFNGPPITNLIDSGSDTWYGDSCAVGNIPVPEDYEKKDIIVGESSSDVISQFPVNPNDDNDKDNKKIAVLPNVPSLKDNLNNLGNVNGGKLPIKFPDPDPVSGLIPSIPVLGNNGVTINIPVTNNNYQVINNYDEHQEIYNENNSYPTINYNYVNYYINEGAMTYEQFLQALQKYFNVITYNNETNNYYPSTINNVTNNYYTIEEVIQEEIPPILPPSRIAITDRFPFCLPFDIYKILVLFNAEPKAWEWDVPVPTFKSGGTSTDNYHGEIGHIDYSETMHISLEQWEPVAVVLRIALGVLWLLYLCFLFQKLVH